MTVAAPVKVAVPPGIYVCWKESGLPAISTRWFTKQDAEDYRRTLMARSEDYVVKEFK